jgi:SAM-dependent methyltransferase
MSDPVHAQYEALPYPPRDPRDEAKRLVIGSPSCLAEIEHYVFGGTIDRAKPFRALIAGGGTGDATTMLAQQLADAKMNAEVVYLDWSQASRKIAEARVAARGLTNVRFVSASLLDLPTLGLGQFDYIDCCGVLHHLDDPAEGLALLTDALTQSGGMGLMLYGRLGRRGVYDLQSVLRAVTEPDADHGARLELARRLIGTLPATNWFARNPFIGDHRTQGDAGLADLLLHPRDRAYTVDEIQALVHDAALRVVAFTPKARYEPEHMVSDARLKVRLARLPAEQKPAVAENLAGNIKTHALYVVRRANMVVEPTVRPDAVPVPFNVDFPTVAKTMKPGAAVSATIDGLQFTFSLPRRAPLIATQIDGTRDLRAIHEALAASSRDLTWDAFLAEFAVFYGAFHALGKLVLRVPAHAAA